MSDGSVTLAVVVADPRGLHPEMARDAWRGARRYRSEVTVASRGRSRRLDGGFFGDYFGLLFLGLRHGNEVTVEARGPDAAEAAEAVRTVLGAEYDPRGGRRVGFETAEHRAALPAEVGFECTFYEGLYLRTASLRQSLYVTVAAEGVGEFRPCAHEHFPKEELRGYQVRGGGWLLGVAEGFRALGQREPVELAFRFYSPPGSGSAAEGAVIISEGIAELGARMSLSEWSRSMAAIRDAHRCVGEHGLVNHVYTLYRPPPGALAERPEGAPKPPPRTLDDAVEDKLREWGLDRFADYHHNRMRKGAR